jgi:hypothetical protein
MIEKYLEGDLAAIHKPISKVETGKKLTSSILKLISAVFIIKN